MATWLKEHRLGSFRRSLQLPQEVNESEINAHFEDGEGTSGQEVVSATEPAEKRGDRGTRSPVEPTEDTYAQALDYAEAQHTDVHDRGSRLMELLQDAMVVLLNVTLLGMGFAFLYRVWMEIFAFGDLQQGLSNIIFVVITIELYRLSVHYLKYHRVDLNILVEVGVSAIIQKIILVGVDQFTVQQLIGISLILVALGAILWVHVRERRYDKLLTSPYTEDVADPQATMKDRG